MKRILSMLGAVGLALVLAVSGWAQNGAKSVVGRTVAKSGTPLAKAVVYLKNTSSLQVRTCFSAEDGSFKFQGLSGDANYEIHAEHDGASSDTKNVGIHDNRPEVQVTLKIDK